MRPKPFVVRRYLHPIWLAVVACQTLLCACTQLPTLVMEQQRGLIPDGIAISIYTSTPPVTFRSSGGKFIEVPFLPTKKLSSQGLSVPDFIHPKYHVQDWVVNPATGDIAVLTSTERWGLWPPELLAAFSGHPIPHNVFYLELFKPNGELLTVTKCIEGTYLAGRIEWGP